MYLQKIIVLIIPFGKMILLFMLEIRFFPHLYGVLVILPRIESFNLKVFIYLIFLSDLQLSLMTNLVWPWALVQPVSLIQLSSESVSVLISLQFHQIIENSRLT